jgi:hypothetical protein
MLAAGPVPAASRCHGAAARDPGQRCSDGRHLSVTPTPDQAEITPNIACSPGEVADMAEACAFGVPSSQAVGVVALIGDSHAAHWRAGLNVVAKARRWRVLEISRPHCPFSFHAPALGKADRAACLAWNRRVIAWLKANPWLSRIFVSNNSRLPMAQRGLGPRIDGHVSALKALPRSVKRVWILRDPPPEPVTTHDCVRRAVRHKRSPGSVCAVPRARALVRDATVLAAHRIRARRVRVIDLTPFFCDARNCFPVVGGVLVHKDADHLTQQFSASLGPYILRAI